MATQLIQPGAESRSPAKLTKMVYAALLLIATSGAFFILFTDYSIHLVATNRFSLARTVEEDFSPAQSLFCLLQLLVLLVVLHRDIKQMFDFQGAPRAVGNILLGISAGVIALSATLPSFLGSHQTSGNVLFLANHFYSVSGLGLAVLLVFLLPITAEIFFRGIFLRQVLENISPVSAVIVSTLLFLLSWPTFNLIAGAALGLAAGILFYRTRSVLACIFANASFTVGTIMLQISRLR
jgi:membrane protease YdiL (CAAX protease family)